MPSDAEGPVSTGIAAAVRSLDEQVCTVLSGSRCLSELSELEMIVAESDWPIGGGLAPDVERIVVDGLARALNFEGERPEWDDLSNFAELARHPGPWVQLLRVAELRNRVDVNDELSLELWSTRSVRFNLGYRTSTIPPLLYALRQISEAETHLAGGLGWHIHPVKNGMHLGYRLLFDAAKTQNDLAWEAHAHPNRRPWGNPAKSVLTQKTSQELHKSALRAVRAQSVLRHMSFRDWASKFVQPSKAAFVVHPHLNQPMPW